MEETIFKKIKHVKDDGTEYWKARELMQPLGYLEWRKFEGAIIRAMQACKNSTISPSEHFVGADNMFKIAEGRQNEAVRKIDDYHLTRYACYLIAQNGDPRKEEIALAQTYFAVQTRRQEIRDELMEDFARIYMRSDMKEKNKKLNSTAKDAGVTRYSKFHDSGYMGLYGGEKQSDIHARKRLKPNERILDHMGSEELGANIFRATQTAAKMKRENIIGENKANEAHFSVGKKVRQTIKELGGVMPEKLPTPDNIRNAKKRLKGRS